MKEIRLGTIGSGMIVHQILDQIRTVDGVRLSAVYSRSSCRAEELAACYGAQKTYTRIDRLLDDESVNCVYIASPNSLHYEQTMRSLLAGKHVICEKPFCTTLTQAKELVALARERGLFLVDAVPTTFLPNYQLLLRELPRIGPVKAVQCNYSQYSSRYDALLRGETPNVFNPKFAGGSLMDIGFYNIYLTVALFGLPQTAAYYPILHPNGIDTSGLAVMGYDGFTAHGVGAKDSHGVNFFQIQGELGYIRVKGGSNGLAELEVMTPDGPEHLNHQSNPNRWAYEVQAVCKYLLTEDRQAFDWRLALMTDVIGVLEGMRKQAGLLFPGD